VANRALTVRQSGEVEPKQLDQPIVRAVGALGQALDAWEVLHPLVADFLAAIGVEVRRGLNDEMSPVNRRDPKTGVVYEVTYMDREGEEVTKDVWMRDVARDLVVWVEKLSRALAAMTKTVDEAARLREFLTGGPDSRPDLTNAGDTELLDTLVEVAVARGLVDRIVARAKAVASARG